MQDGEPLSTRIGVGNHLMLGGDNMDLALAHLVEGRASSGRRRTRGSRPASSRSSSSAAAPPRNNCSAPTRPNPRRSRCSARASKLVGGARSAQAVARGNRADHRRRLLSGGVTRSERPGARARRHRRIRAAVCERSGHHAAHRGVSRAARGAVAAGAGPARIRGSAVACAGYAPAQRRRLSRRSPDRAPRGRRSARWRGSPLHLLHNANPDVAVARGAVAYALARAGHAPRIGGGSPRSFFLLLDEDGQREARRLPPAARHGRRPRDPAGGPHLRAAARARRCAFTWRRRSRTTAYRGRRTRRPVRGGGRLRAPAADRNRHARHKRAVSAKRPSN